MITNSEGELEWKVKKATDEDDADNYLNIEDFEESFQSGNEEETAQQCDWFNWRSIMKETPELRSIFGGLETILEGKIHKNRSEIMSANKRKRKYLKSKKAQSKETSKGNDSQGNTSFDGGDLEASSFEDLYQGIDYDGNFKN
jgi:hypothetical protein